MFKATPKMAAKKIRGKSTQAIFSFGPKKAKAQNNTVAPNTRKSINPKGIT